MKRTAMLGVMLALSLTACGGSGKKSAADQQLQQRADYYAIDQIEKTWHKAASTQNVDLMMSLWANDATFNIGPETLDGKMHSLEVKVAGDGRTVRARKSYLARHVSPVKL